MIICFEDIFGVRSIVEVMSTFLFNGNNWLQVGLRLFIIQTVQVVAAILPGKAGTL